MQSQSAQKTRTARPLIVPLDEESKRCLADAAGLRGISVSDYVRTVTVSQARREVHAAEQRVIAMTADEQMSFWSALNQTPRLTSAQCRLGTMMQGQA